MTKLRNAVRAAAAMVAVAPVLLPGLGLPKAAAQTLKPKLPVLSGIVKDADWARVLGKALFWDTTVGSDWMRQLPLPRRRRPTGCQRAQPWPDRAAAGRSRLRCDRAAGQAGQDRFGRHP